jgi:hypothetical protein
MSLGLLALTWATPKEAREWCAAAPSGAHVEYHRGHLAEDAATAPELGRIVAELVKIAARPGARIALFQRRLPPEVATHWGYSYRVMVLPAASAKLLHSHGDRVTAATLRPLPRANAVRG